LEKKIIDVDFVLTEEMIADIQIKASTKKKHNWCYGQLGLVYRSIDMTREEVLDKWIHIASFGTSSPNTVVVL